MPFLPLLLFLLLRWQLSCLLQKPLGRTGKLEGAGWGGGGTGRVKTQSDQIRSDQSFSRVRLFATPWIAAHQASLSITNSRSSLRLTSIESVMPSSHLILCCSLLLLPPIPPSIRVFSNESTLRMRWQKYWSFRFSIIPSKEIPGLIFRMDWLEFLAVQGTLKSLLQHHSSKASILRHSSLIFTLNSVGPGSHSLVPCSSFLSQDWALYVSLPVYQEDGMYCSKAHPQHPSQDLAPRRYLTNCFYWLCSIISLES